MCVNCHPCAAPPHLGLDDDERLAQELQQEEDSRLAQELARRQEEEEEQEALRRVGVGVGVCEKGG